MTQTQLSRHEVAQRGKKLYSDNIRAKVECPDDIGKMVIIDVETGDFEIDELGIDSARKLRERHPEAHLFGLRIGYNVAESFGGVIERTTAK